MAQLLVNLIFNLITGLFNIIMSPFFSALYALFPDLATYFNYVMDFLDTAFQYVATVRDLLLIPTTAMTLFFSYLLIKFSIYLLRQAINLSIKIYSTLKP